jgi:predicted nucleic acid-binding protein
MRSRVLRAAGGLLVDTNLLVLFVVGAVNRDRIKTFKRTSQHTQEDYDLLLRIRAEYRTLYTVAHVLAEVSNLTDLTGPERQQARSILKEAILLLTEAEMPSARAAEDVLYPKLGLVDASIGAVARAHKCTVLTDDLDLYHLLMRQKVKALNFTFLRAQKLKV